MGLVLGKERKMPTKVIRWLTQLTCSHHWVRARWSDGSYGLRCSACMKPYAVTWNELLKQEEATRGGAVAMLPTRSRDGAAPGPIAVEARSGAGRPLVA